MTAEKTQSTSVTVLLVDDEAAVLRSLKRELYYWSVEKNVTLLTAQSGEEALTLLGDQHASVGLVIADLKMPGMQGSDLLLRIHEQFPEISLILLTAYTDIPEVRKAVSAAIHAFVLKPWETDHLIAEIEKALQIRELRREKDTYIREVQEQLKTAGNFQRQLLQTDLPDSDRISVSVTYTPVSGFHIGGDYYDLIALGDESYLVLVGDVSGHGIRPAFVTGILKVLIRDYIRQLTDDFSPAAFLRELNSRLCRELSQIPDILISLSVMLVDLQRSELVYANAGHLPVFLLREVWCTAYRTHGTALGFSPQLSYTEERVPLEDGDMLVTFTDGLIDRGARDEHVDEQFLQHVFIQARGADCFNDQVFRLTNLDGNRNSAHDDVTLVSLRILKTGK